MKKNLLNAALLGLLIATPACSFVSCKDYDDDFNKVNNRLGDLETARTQINTEITSLKSQLETANQKAAKLESDLANYATKTELSSGLAGKADKTELTAGLAGKADKTELTAGLATKADKTALDAAVANLAQVTAQASALEGRIATLESARTELTTLINSKVDQTAYDAKVAEIEGKLAAADTKITALQGLVTAVQGLQQVLTELNERVTTQQTTLTSYKERIEKLEKAGFATNADVAKAVADLKAELEGKITTLQNEVNTLKNAGFQTKEQVDAAVKVVADKVAELQAALDVLRTSNVTSLVFAPNRFHEGIESIESTEFVYNALDVDKVGDNNVVDFTKELTAAAAASAPVTFATAYYYVNPGTAKIDTTDLKKYNFVSIYSYATAGTAGASAARTLAKNDTIVATKASYQNGVLAVGFRYNLPNERGNAAAKNINVVALQYNAGEGTEAKPVTSDFARVLSSSYSAYFIGKSAASNDLASIYFKTAPTTGGATPLKGLSGNAKDEQLFAVPNDGTVLKLDSLVRTYALNDENNTPEPADVSAAHNSQLKEAGFHYEFSLVKDGANDKSTEVFELTKEGEVKAKFDSEKPFQNLGKEAVVRVSLVAPNGEVAAVGYYFLRVTAPATSVATLTSTSELKFTCADTDDAAGTLTIDGDTLTQYLAKTSGIEASKVWDRGNFSIETSHGAVAGISDGSVLAEYTVADGKATYTANNKYIGVIKRVVANGKLQFVWTGITKQQVADLQAGGSKSVFVKIIKGGEPHNIVYAELKWAPATAQAAPTVAFTGKAISNDWFTNQNVAGEKEIRMHVSIDGNNTFTHDLTEDFVKGSIVKPTLGAEYGAVATGLKTGWRFVTPKHTVATGTNGVNYQLSVNEAGTVLFAQPLNNAGQVVTGSNKTAVAGITSAGVIKFQNNYVTQKLLNYAASTELEYGKTLTARVAYQSTLCDGKTVLTTTGDNHEFDVRFLRPLTASYTGSASFTDAQQANQPATINFDFALTDWRQVKDASINTIYKVDKVGFAPESEWTTDLNGGDITTQKLVANFGNRGLSLDLSAGTAPSGLGAADFVGYKEYNIGSYPTLNYTTNSNNFTTFKVRIPVYLHYAWGEVKSYVDVTVGKTLNQARRK